MILLTLSLIDDHCVKKLKYISTQQYLTNTNLSQNYDYMLEIKDQYIGIDLIRICADVP